MPAPQALLEGEVGPYQLDSKWLDAEQIRSCIDYSSICRLHESMHVLCLSQIAIATTDQCMIRRLIASATACVLLDAPNFLITDFR